MQHQIEISINGEVQSVPTRWSVEDLVESLGDLQRGPVAVEHNETILRREEWPRTPLQKGDRVEIVHFVGGGEF